MTVADIHPNDALQNVLAEFEKQVREGKRVAQDIPCLRKDGAIVYVDINATNATIDGRKCLVGVFRDITERKQAEKKQTQEAARAAAGHQRAPTVASWSRPRWRKNSERSPTASSASSTPISAASG